jgi:uncharacterized protein (TIGR03032 family)
MTDSGFVHAAAKRAAPADIEAPNLSVSPGLRQWMLAQQLSIAFTSYQTGRLLLMGVGPDGLLAFSKQDYKRAMGLHYADGVLHLAAVYQIWRLHNMLDPGQYANNAYDCVLIPRTAHTTGYVDAHELAIDKAGRVIFVNTRFSCLATIDERHSFRPVWKPPFISGLYPEDRCHLNGLAMEDGVPRYVTAVNTTDVEDGWRETPGEGGVVVDVPSGEIVATGLSMPHSPRVHDGALWVLDSGRGFLVRIDPASGRSEDIAFCPGFLRGMTIHNGFAVVAVSQARHGSFGKLPLQKELDKRRAAAWCGLLVIDLANGKMIEYLRINSGFTELFDVAAIPGFRNPMSVGPATEEIVKSVRFNPEFAPLVPDGA